MKEPLSIIPLNNIRTLIYAIRGEQVMLDSDLAEIYGVETKAFNQAVKRNIERFPEAFRFQLTAKEYENLTPQLWPPDSGEPLRSQIVSLEKGGRGQHRKYLPYAFTEQGVSMLSAVLRSETAVKVSIQIINAFVEMRRFLILDERDIYHIGASLKDPGKKKWFAFSKFETGALDMLKKLGGCG